MAKMTYDRFQEIKNNLREQIYLEEDMQDLVAELERVIKVNPVIGVSKPAFTPMDIAAVRKEFSHMKEWKFTKRGDKIYLYVDTTGFRYTDGNHWNRINAEVRKAFPKCYLSSGGLGSGFTFRINP